MQTFKQKKIALAVGASLLVMAGAAQAAAPIVRATKPALIVGGGLTTTLAHKLYDGQGYNGLLNVSLMFTAPASTATNATQSTTPSVLAGATAGLDVEQLSAGTDGLHINGLTYGQAGGGGVVPDATVDDISVYTVNGTTLTTLSVANLGFAANTGGATGATTTATAAMTLDSGAAPAAFRLSAAGALEWIADLATAATAANWLPVNIRVNLPTTATLGITGADRWAPIPGSTLANVGATASAFDAVTLNTGASTVATATKTAIVAVAGQGIFSTIIPTPIVSTRATGGLVDGITYDTLTPLLAFATANVAATTANITAVDVSCPDQAVSLPVTVGTVASSAAPGYSAGATGVAKYPIIITTPATTVDWKAANGTTVAALDNAAYKTKCFSTGIGTLDGGLAAPFTVGNLGAVPVTSYSLVFDAFGRQASAADFTTAAFHDGAAPVVTSIGFTTPDATTGVTNLSLSFSENMAVLTGAGIFNTSGDLREALENISVGTAGANGATTLAALELNSGLTPTLTGTGLTADKLTTDKLTINNVQAADIATLAGALWTGKSITVGTGIAFKETNDSGYTAVPQLDTTAATGPTGEQLAGGYGSATGVTEAASGTLAATAAPVTVVWGTDTTATGHAAIGAPTVVDTITVTFATGKEVKLAPAGTVFGTNAATALVKTAADLAAQLVIDVYGSNGVQFQVHPTTVSGTAASATGGNTLTITLPTNLIYSKLTAQGAYLKAMYVSYVPTVGTTDNNVLVAVTGSTLTAPIAVTGSQADRTGVATLTAAGPEPVDLPLVFTATATGSQSTLLTQDIQSNVAGAAAGSIVDAYLAYWVDLPKVTTTLVGADIKSGKITNPGDKVATDLAIEFTDGTGDLLAARIAAELNKVKPAVALKAGVNEAAAAVPAKDIPVYVKLVRSNDAVANTKGSQNYLESRAILATTRAEAQLDGLALIANSTAAAVAGNTALNGAGAKSVAYAVSYAASAASTTQKAAVAAEAVRVAAAVAAAAGAANKNAADTAGVASLEALALAFSTDVNPVYEVLLNPTTGKITGRLTGDLTYKPGSATTTSRGLRFLDANGVDTATATLHGSTLVGDKSATNLALPGTANMNLLMGIDPVSTDIGALQALNPFVLLVHRDSTGKYTMLTSADPAAANYVPFAPDLLNLTTGTGGIAVRATTPLSVTDVKAFDLPVSSNWALYGIGKPATRTPVPAVAADKAFPRKFVGLDTVAGKPVSFWTNDGGTVGDMAIAMAGNKVGVATELLTDTGATTGPTLTNITDTSYVKNAVALAWDNENGATDGASAMLGKIYVAQATGAFAPAVALTAPVLAPGWSLVTVPGTVGAAVTTLGTVVDAVIKVGAQVGMTASSTPLTVQPTGSGAGTGQFTWFAVDGAMPSLVGGEAVFVHAKAAGNL